MASHEINRRPLIDKQKRIDKNVISIEPIQLRNCIDWELPPSKSHVIRALLIASQSEKTTTIKGIQFHGEDVKSMKNCLMKLGVKIEEIDSKGEIISQSKVMNRSIDSLRVHGVGRFGFCKPKGTLNVGNSGTTLRLIALLCSRFDFSVNIDGDDSLRRRDTQVLWSTLIESGVNVSFDENHNHLPVKISGPWFNDHSNRAIQIDMSKSSQPFSAWMLSSPGLSGQIELNLKGDYVSNRHWKLSLEMCQNSGANITLDRNYALISPWEVEMPNQFNIPKDASMASFAMLSASCLETEVNLIGWPDNSDCLGHEILNEISTDLGISWINDKLKSLEEGRSIEVDITDSNDIITPLSIIMALGHGGKILGASHSSFKESNRIESSNLLLKSFGMFSKITDDGLIIPGGQEPSRPSSIVMTFGDHRVFMSAVILACRVGAKVEGLGLHNIADELFIQRLFEQK